MGLFDDVGGALKGVLGQVEAGGSPSLIAPMLAQTNLGSLQGIVAKLQEGGLGSQVQSWLGNGSNMPISADQLRDALGNEHVQEIARHFGLPIDGALKLLAQHLPAAVDQASTNGAISPAV